MNLSAEEIILRWFNYHLARVCPRLRHACLVRSLQSHTGEERTGLWGELNICRQRFVSSRALQCVLCAQGLW